MNSDRPSMLLGSAAGLILLAVLVGCGGRSAPPPGPGFETGIVPDLRGQRVMVLPFQLRRGGHADVDAEFLFALRSRPVAAEWMGPGELQDALARNPGTGVRLDALNVQPFLMGEVRRIGDPLFGELYRLGTLLDARLAVLPVEVRSRPEGDEGDRVVEAGAAVLDTRTGHVLWYGIMEGPPGPPGDRAATVGALEALAGRILP
jgi:hypothetical protein